MYYLNKLVLLYLLVSFTQVYGQHPVTNYMQTHWTGAVNNEHPLNEYPRPQMVRTGWTNLNGQWKYCFDKQGNLVPQQWDGDILVPFPPESYLSGVRRGLQPDHFLWYRREFVLTSAGHGRQLLHFGACDWRTKVYINRQLAGIHEGGYSAFSMDITSYVREGNNEIAVCVADPTDNGDQARGKQVLQPGGIYYTRVSGIWQTVWMEQVNKRYIKSYKVTANPQDGIVQFYPDIVGASTSESLSLQVYYGGKKVGARQFKVGEDITFKMKDIKPWDADHPNLYHFSMTLKDQESVLDHIKGYFAMRKVEMKRDAAGTPKITLNNKPVFLLGVLDQGYWPDGLYAYPTEQAMRNELDRVKRMGFNTIRKHVKVEPDRWYYYCDSIGLLVCQDMPSGFKEIVPVKDHGHSTERDWLNMHYADLNRSPASEQNFRKEWSDIITQLYNHPSIVMWIPFNESWGQFKTNEIIKWTKHLDSSRLVDGPSGWIDRGEGDLRDYHLYNERLAVDFPLQDKRILFIGEFGGLGFIDSTHVMKKESWSYDSFKTPNDMLDAYKKLIMRIKTMKSEGFAGAIYTQLTDVESEVNGLITYDRKEVKLDPEAIRKINRILINN